MGGQTAGLADDEGVVVKFDAGVLFEDGLKEFEVDFFEVVGFSDFPVS